MNRSRVRTILIAATMLAASAAHADQRSDIDAACRTQQWLPDSACPCIADRAMKSLNEHQQAWLLASVRKDQTEATRLQGEMTQNELVELGTFMAQESLDCQQ